MRKGICVAGNMIVDTTYPVAGWPNQGELVHIKDGITQSTGGAVCNVAVDLAKLDPALPVQALGRIGTDAEGDLILKTFGEHTNIDTANVLREGMTAFTHVMADVHNKQRTFFTYLGASARFTEADIRWDSVRADIFHIGYILLLDALDQPDDEYGTKMARLLHAAQAHGLRTSIDVVSEAGDRFKRIVTPALKYTDYCVINEYEAEQTTGIPLRDADGGLIRENLPGALKAMKALGVSRWAVIHAPEGGFGMDETGAYIRRGSLILPAESIVGSVGAGDAFCAGVLLGAERGWSIEQAIDLGIAAAASSLSDASATGGVCSAEEAMGYYTKYDRR